MNTAITLQRLGVEAAFVGRVGTDGLGTAIRRRLRAEGVSIAHLRDDAEAPTGMLVRTASPAQPLEVVYGRAGSAGARLDRDDVEAARAAVEGARWLHVTGVTTAISPSAREALAHAVAIALAAQITISLDLNFRRKLWSADEARAALAPLISAADVVFCGFDEAQALFGAEDAAAAAATLHGAGAEVAVVRCGGRFVLHHARGAAPLEHAVASVDVVDPVGAGDAFDGGYIAARLDGAGDREAVQLGEACKAGALCAVGDTTGLPSRAAAEAAIAGEVGDDR